MAGIDRSSIHEARVDGGLQVSGGAPCEPDVHPVRRQVIEHRHRCRKTADLGYAQWGHRRRDHAGGET